jgi:two-component sensor histidine kinase
MLKKDLQNRARTMALIHETLYRTRKFSDVDMNVYLNILVEQIVNSYRTDRPLNTSVEAQGVTLDLVRATPIGLIVNELVTNSLKYAFPQKATPAGTDQEKPCTIGIQISADDGNYLMKVSDNGIGLPAGWDIKETQTLGLKLVNFLARHQLRAKIEINTDKGTEFVFRFRKSSKMDSIPKNDPLVS